MSRTSIEEITAEQRAEVETLLRRRDLSARQRERLEMVKAWALGQDLAAIARWSGRTGRTVARWLRRFAQGGPAAVADGPRAGPPPPARAAGRAGAGAGAGGPPRGLGGPVGVWGPARLSGH